MKKSIIIISGILLLIKQGTIIGMEAIRKPIEVTLSKNVKIIIQQKNIAETKNIDAIVSPTTFNLDNNLGVAKALATADPQWDEESRENIKTLRKKYYFKKGKTRSAITPTFKLKYNGVKWIINTVGPEGSNPNWEKLLREAYFHTLFAADKHKVRDIIFPPISTGNNSLDSDGRVVITPTKAATIAFSAIQTYIHQNPRSFIRKIYFTSRPEDGPVHFFAHAKAALKAMKRCLTDDNEKELADSEEKYIWNLEAPTKFAKFQKYITNKKDVLKNFIKQRKAPLALGTLAILASLYLLKKYQFLP